jgi:hypothetical protein
VIIGKKFYTPKIRVLQQAAASPGPRGGGTSKASEQVAPLDVQVATVTHEARGSSERRRCEVSAAMIARDILRSNAVWEEILMVLRVDRSPRASLDDVESPRN